EFLRNFENVSQEATGLTLYHHKNLASLPTRAVRPDLTNDHSSCPVASARKEAYDRSVGRRGTPPPVVTPPSTGPTLPPINHPNFQTGMAIPLWGTDAYGDTDTAWSSGLQSIRSQAGAKWIEMPLLFSQATYASTKVIIGSNTPSIDSFEKGVRKAHAQG